MFASPFWQSILTMSPLHSSRAHKQYEENYYFAHDSLSQLTCKKTREWLVESGIYKQWLLPVDPCNEGTIYHGRPVGNSPSIMSWDCSLNRDVHAKVDYYSTLFNWVPKDHPLYAKRFSKSSPKIIFEGFISCVRCMSLLRKNSTGCDQVLGYPSRCDV